MLKNNFITANWNCPSNIKTLITTKNNSKFSLRLKGDDIETSIANRQTLAELINNPLYWLNQSHSATATSLDNIEFDNNADAAFTFSKNKACVVLTADCLPILLTDTRGSFVAAIHAGWKGLLAGIISNTLAKLNFNQNNNIIAYIGPAICQNHFEVGSELYDAFIAKNNSYMPFFQPKHNNKFDCDLIAIAKLDLILCGVEANNIYLSNLCTSCNNNLFYSYRKEVINDQFGNFASCIWME
ncbi:MAG: peptidoglycan editing factor PgeF [Burkholderiales bacterium]|nr:peptidoglycan editing factor PgeF [Burkholderiales bacterium]